MEYEMDHENTKGIFNPSIFRLFKELKKYKYLVILALIFSVVSSLMFVSAPAKLSEITDIISKAVDQGKDVEISEINKIAKYLALLCLLAVLILYSQTYILASVSNSFARDLRSRISKKINRLDLAYFDKNSVGDILSRVTNDIDTIAQSLNQSIGWFLNSIALVLGALILMFYTNAILAITSVLASLFGMFLVLIIIKKSRKHYSLKQKSLGQLNGHVEEIYSGLNVVKIYNAEEKLKEEFDSHNKNLYGAVLKSQFMSASVMPLMNLTGSLGFLTVTIVGGYLVLKNQISFGTVIAFMLYVRMFSNPISQIANAFIALQATGAASERVFEFFDQEEMKKDTNSLEIEEIKGDIVFENVRFSYPESEKETIKDFSAKVKAGQKIAIVGPTGAGKTTIVNLLMRFYEIDSGKITIDGIDIKDMSKSYLRELFTMVLQDAWLFEGSIMDNIKFNKDLSDQKVYEICKSIGLHHHIMSLPKTYNSSISEEGVSAGQKQLITIARGMVKDSPFIILDEATSNVDTRTEGLVQDAMDKLSKKKTSFIIAHRLSTIKNADLILFIRDGNIVEQGSHDELLQKKEEYYKLYQSQFLQS